MGPEASDGRSDTALVAAAREGDRAAFAELIGRHRAAALGVTARLLGSAEAASDAVQEASLLAMTSLDRLRSTDRFGSWLCGIALNVARRALRGRSRVAPVGDLAPQAAVPGPAEQVEAAHQAAAVREAVATLAEGQREAVMLFYLQGLTHREIAAELGISTGAVKARLHQARAVLAVRLEPLLEREETTAMTTARTDDWVEVEVVEVRRFAGDDPDSRKHVILLRERDGERTLPIWIGPFEATAVAMSLTATEMPRPLTYQFIDQLLTATGGRVSRVRVASVVEEIYYATVVLDVGGAEKEVDCRPSDAINLALVAGSPVVVEAGLLDTKTQGEGWQVDHESAEQIAEDAMGRIRHIPR